ncbi:MAG: hypothetical protein JWQ53_3112 [Klenkia sp.]|nr:hypothetical protein [Klenkia sp.]
MLRDRDVTSSGDLSVGYLHVGCLGTVDTPTTTALLDHLRPRLEAGDPLVLACSTALRDALQARLPSVTSVAVVDEDVLGGRTADALAGYTALVDAHAPAAGSRLLLVTDSAHGSGRLAQLQTEALLNHVLADRALDHVCLLDQADLGEDVHRASSCHPRLLGERGVVANAGYREPADLLRELGQADLSDPLETGPPTLALDDVDDLRGLRRALQGVFADGPLPADDAEDLVLAIDEVVANAAEHGVPPVEMRLWVTAERVLCVVSDHGPGFDEPLSGYGPAHGGDLSVGGMGLWLARRAVDSMTTGQLTAEGEGCVVRLVVDPRSRAPR